jgi:hypothetical protein
VRLAKTTALADRLAALGERKPSAPEGAGQAAADMAAADRLIAELEKKARTITDRREAGEYRAVAKTARKTLNRLTKGI